MTPAARAAELAENLAAVRERIAEAAGQAARDPSEVTLIAVTKTFPASDVRLLAELGVTDIGENRDQEAREKARECADVPLDWHFVGQLQSNKANSVARYATVVHSVDRGSLVQALGRAATQHGRELRCLLQVGLSERSGQGGVPAAEPDRLLELADEVAATSGLTLGGVMGIAPLGEDPAPAFARLAELAGRLRTRHADATWISAGMSDDLTAAIAHGATHVRIGRRLLGERPTRR